MLSRKAKYVIPAGATFGSLPQKAEHLPEAEQKQKDYTALRLEHLYAHLGLEGFYFKWGYIPFTYPDLSEATIDILWQEWNRQQQLEGQRIAHAKALADFNAHLIKRKEELGATHNRELKSILQQQVEILSALSQSPFPQGVKVSTPTDDSFIDWFPDTAVNSINMNELSQDILELCQDYIYLIEQMEGKHTSAHDMETMDGERADYHNRLIALLAERGTRFEERGDYIDFAEKVVKWHGVF